MDLLLIQDANTGYVVDYLLVSDLERSAEIFRELEEEDAFAYGEFGPFLDKLEEEGIEYETPMCVHVETNGRF